MPGRQAAEIVSQLRARFEAQADPATARGMAHYMRDQFTFLGLKTPVRRGLERPVLAPLRQATEAEVLAIADGLWELPEREYQYAAVGLLAGAARRLGPGSLGACERLITTKPWWDTVDGLAAQVAGIVVLHHREEAAVMDRWLESEVMWLRRAAIIHQLKWKAQTDTARLFGYCLARAGEREFFIRKAIGWALRQYSWTDPAAVQAFVSEHEAALSGLSRREALLVINGGRRKTGRGIASNTGGA